MFNKGLFILAHECGDPSFYSSYKKLVNNQWKNYDELKQEQEKQLKHLIEFAYKNVPYYHKLFKDLGLLPRDVQTISNLEKLPVLTKDTIREHWEEFKPANLPSLKYYSRATGGSTGIPLQYRLSKADRFLEGALLYRGWGYGGFELGDKMVFLAGSSLDVGTKSHIVTKAHEIARNIRKLSSFDMGESEMKEYVRVLNSFRPRFIRGYASSVYFFARWLEKAHYSFSSPEGVFTTAEKLFPHMRKTIENIFDCEVYDTYGLNDGGISAFECPEHAGLHIDTERGIVEVIDDEGLAIERGEGQILATSLYNYAMPFIRYATGDEGYLLDDSCNCGRNYLLLKEILGRQQEMLITPEGKHIHGSFISVLIKEIPHVKEFQIKQKDIDHLEFTIVSGSEFNEADLEHVKKLIQLRSPGWKVRFQFLDAIDRTRAGKYKFVINEISDV